MEKKSVIFLFILSLCISSLAKADLSLEQKKTFFEQANDYFTQANSTNDSEKAKELYQKAILNYNKIIDDGNVKNAKLYYNLANTYFLNGNIGKAILNYRRAELLDGSDENIKKNLAFARSKRTDVIATNTEKRILQTLFFWHYDFSIKTKFIMTCVLLGILFLCGAFGVRFGLKGPLLVGIVICVILVVCFLSSIAVETRNQSRITNGVITAEEVIAHQADWQDSPPSFKEPLHEGTEFELIESRPRWYHIKLSDDSDGWIPSDAAELI